MHVCIYVCMHACMYVCMYVCMYACMHVCMYVCMLIYIYIYICICICICICVYIYTYVYIYIYIYTTIHVMLCIIRRAQDPGDQLRGHARPRHHGHLHSAKGGAVETGCNGLHNMRGCFIILYYPHPLHPLPTAPPCNEYHDVSYRVITCSCLVGHLLCRMAQHIHLLP